MTNKKTTADNNTDINSEISIQAKQNDLFFLTLPQDAVLNKEQVIKQVLYTPLPKSFNPVDNTTNINDKITSNLFEGLIVYNPYLGKYVGGVAQSWDVNETGKIYTFHLRPTAKWSDGVNVTAQNFVDAWSLFLTYLEQERGFELTKTLANISLNNLYNILQGQDENVPEINTKLEELGIKALDNHTLQITLSNPISWLIPELSNPLLAPIPSHKIKELGNAWSSKKNLVNNGPFKIKLTKPKKGVLTLERNTNYWSTDTQIIQEIEFSQVKDRLENFARFNDNAADFSLIPVKEIYNTFSKGVPANLMRSPARGMLYLQFNLENRLSDDIKYRKAISLILDSQEVLEKNIFYSHTLIPVNKWTIFGFAPAQSHQKNDYYAAQVKEAITILTELGYTTKKPLKLSIFNKASSNPIYGLSLKDILAVLNEKTAGLVQASEGTKAKNNLSLEFKINDINNSSNLLFSNQFDNLGFLYDSQYKNIKADTSYTFPNKESIELTEKVNQVLVNENYFIIPMGYIVNNTLVAPNLYGYSRTRETYRMQFLYRLEPDTKQSQQVPQQSTQLTGSQNLDLKDSKK